MHSGGRRFDPVWLHHRRLAIGTPIPSRNKNCIRQLLDALRALPLPPRARFTIEYVLLNGVNDTLADAQRLVIKICNWDGVVPQPALDGFTLPAGKWVDYQKNGWRVESYVVAPNAEGSKNGFYAILTR